MVMVMVMAVVVKVRILKIESGRAEEQKEQKEQATQDKTRQDETRRDERVFVLRRWDATSATKEQGGKYGTCIVYRCGGLVLVFGGCDWPEWAASAVER